MSAASPPSLAEATDRDLTRWTLYAGIALTEILERAYLADMRPLVWEAAGTALVGTVKRTHGHGDQEAEFLRWIQHLGAELDREMVTADGVRFLQAFVKYRTVKGGHRVTVTLKAQVQRHQKVIAPPAG